MLIKYPCKICNNPVAENHKAVQCDKCQLWVRMKCSKINIQTYNIMKEDETTWYCISCSKDVFPFSGFNDNEFYTTTQGKKMKFLTIAKKRSSNEHRLLDRINDAIDGENLKNSSTYFDVSDLNSSFPNSSFPKNQFNGTNFFHMNISSLCH